MTTTTQATKVGTFTLTTEHTFSVPQEFAGAYHQIKVPAGTYDIEERVGFYGRLYVGIDFPGVCVASGWNSSCQNRNDAPMTADVYGWSTPYGRTSNMVAFWLGMLARECGGQYSI